MEIFPVKKIKYQIHLDIQPDTNHSEQGLSCGAILNILSLTNQAELGLNKLDLLGLSMLEYIAKVS